MNDDRPHEPETPPHGHEPHGVVGTLREELQEVVEHVPQPVRWTVGKLARVVLLSVALLLVVVIASAALYVANRTELVARELTLVLNQALAQQTDLVLSMRDIKGNPFSGFRVVEPRVRFRSGGPALLEAREMRVGYSAIGLLRGNGPPIEVTVEGAIVRLNGGAGGTWRFPVFRPGRRTAAGKPRVLQFALTLENAEVFAPKPLGRCSGIDLRVTGATGGNARVRLERMRWKQGPWHSRLDALAAEFSSDADSVHVRVSDLRTGDLDATLRADWAAGGAAQRIGAEVRRVRWRWLAEVFDNDEFDVAGEGRITVDGEHAGRWRGRFGADVSWDSLAIAGGGRVAWDGRELAIDSLAGRSAAGDFADASLRWTSAGWTLAGSARNADPSNWHALRLDGWPEGRLNGTFRYVLDSRAKLNSSRLDVRLAPSVWVGWAVDSASVRVDFPGVAEDSFAVDAHRDGGRFLLFGIMDPKGWHGRWSGDGLPLEMWPDGRASGLRGRLGHAEGTLMSRDEGLFVDGELDGRSTDWSAARFGRWRLEALHGRLLPTPDMTMSVRAHDGFFTGVHFDSANAEIHLGDQQLAYAPAHAMAGDTVFTATGTADWKGDRWRTRMTSATATSHQFAWTAEPPLELSGDPRGTLFDRVIANDGEAHLEARGRWAAPGGAYDFEMALRRLDLGRIGMPDDWRLAGRADARLAVTGRSGDPRWTFDGRAMRPGFGGHRCDTVAVALAGAPHTLEVRDLFYGLERGTLRGRLRVERTPNPFPDSLTATAVVRWLQDAGEWSGGAEAEGLTIARLGALAPAAAGWGGQVTGSLRVGGSPQNPDLSLDAVADDIGWKDYRAQRVESHATYRAGVLDVPRTLVTMQDVASTVSGRMPVRLALGREVVVPDAAMAWTVDVPRGDLKLLPALIPAIQGARGRFDVNAAVEGTTRRPRITGRAHIRDGSVRPAGRDEVLDGVYADLRFDESRILLDTLSARQGRTGRVWARGSADLAGFDYEKYGFDLHMRDFASSQEGLYAVLFDGDFKVVDGPRVRGERLPQVLGDVALKRGAIEFDFANQSAVQKRAATTEPLYWTYRVHLRADSKLRWRPPDGDIEFDADLDLEQTADSLLIYGDMHLIKGHYYFLSNRFTLSQADLTFDNQKGVDPTMDLIAQTSLRPSRSELAQGGTWSGAAPASEAIEAHITGRSSEPVIALSSRSGWDQREILGELTYGRFVGEGVTPTDWVQNSLTRQLSNQMSKDLAKFFNDAINQWELERDQGELLSGQGGVVMSVGGDINTRTSWTYRQRLPGLDRPITTALSSGSLFDRDVEVEYRINRFIYATTELTQRRVGQVTVGQSNTEFNVNLKARWEY